MHVPAYYSRSWLGGKNRFWGCSAEPFLNNLPIIILTSGLSGWTRGISYARKNSGVFSVELVISGDAEFVQNSKSYIVRPGQVFLVRKGCDNRFSTGPSGHLNKRMVMMDGVMLGIVLQSLGLHSEDVITLQNPSILSSLIKQANFLMGTAQPGFSWKVSLLAYEILLELARNTSETLLPPEVGTAIGFMTKNIEKSLTLSQISEASGASIFHLCHLFKKSINLPPMAFFQNQKVILAKNLLENSTLLIKEIATILGYEDPFYFSAQFRKLTGLSPRQYRQNKAPI